MNYLRRLWNSILDKLSNGIARRLPQPVEYEPSQEHLASIASAVVARLPDPPAPPAFRQYLGDGEILVQARFFNLIVPGWDVSLTPSILMTCEWEAALTNYLKDKVKPGMVTFDVGANLGWFSSLFASLGASVHAFEPNPRLQRILKKNLFMNAGQLAAMCTVNQCAISSNEYVLPMRFPHWLVGGAGLHDFDQTPFLDSLIDDDIITSVTTLDCHARDKNIQRVDILKIDIEGYEENALLGAAGIISRSPGLILSMEYSRGRYTSSFPGWLFERFSEAYLPAIGCNADLDFLLRYEASAVLPECAYIDMVLVAK